MLSHSHLFSRCRRFVSPLPLCEGSIAIHSWTERASAAQWADILKTPEGLTDIQVHAAQKFSLLQMFLRTSGCAVKDPCMRSATYEPSPHHFLESLDSLMQFSHEPHFSSISPALSFLIDNFRSGRSIDESQAPLNIVICGDSCWSMKEPTGEDVSIPPILQSLYRELGLRDVVVHNLAVNGAWTDSGACNIVAQIRSAVTRK